MCFQVRGLVPKQATLHPDLTPAQMATQYHGLFTGEPLPVSGVYFGTDASGGPRGADPRMRVVSWAVVAVRVTTHPVHSPGEGAYELLGTVTGTLQIGATVNEGEQVAINKLAEWATMPVRSSSDSKVAIKRCLKANIHETLPQVWSTSLAQRELLQVSWTKGHLNPTIGLDLRTGGCGPPTLRPTWPAAESAEVFSQQQANRTDCIDQAARAKFSLLDQRCARILAHDPVPRIKETKFEAAPVAGRKAKPTGPNKRQSAATQGANAHTGQNWVVTSAAKNLCIKCTECSLYG